MSFQDKVIPVRARALQRLTLSAMKIVYDDKASDQLVGLLGQGEPVNAIARVSLLILQRLHEAFPQVPPQAINAMTPIVATLVFDLGSAAGVLSKDKALLGRSIEVLLKPKQPAVKE